VYSSPTVLSGDSATVAATLHGMNGAELVHIAAHGHHQPDNPLFSSLELAGGRLMGYDLPQIGRPPVHVILSACDVGRSTVRHGDEMLGLVAAMLYSGSATVVASLSQVADPTTPVTMVRYHRALAGGVPPARAIADATVDDPTAPFVCFGAG
jgi:CHAT domain-containing protein